MSKPELVSRRRRLDPEEDARIAAFSANPATAPEAPPTPRTPDTVPGAPQAEEAKSKGFNYRMTPSRHAKINAFRKEDERSFQWMMDKLIDPGIEAWNQREARSKE